MQKERHYTVWSLVWGGVAVAVSVIAIFLVINERNTTEKRLQEMRQAIAEVVSSGLTEVFLQQDYPYVETLVVETVRRCPIIASISVWRAEERGRHLVFSYPRGSQSVSASQGTRVVRSSVEIRAQGFPREILGEVELTFSRKSSLPTQ